jgi:uncharacterized membrane-anchored protein YhcB (DUF1043 family)
VLNKKGINGTYFAVALLIGVILGAVIMLYLVGKGDIQAGMALIMG